MIILWYKFFLFLVEGDGKYSGRRVYEFRKYSKYSHVSEIYIFHKWTLHISTEHGRRMRRCRFHIVWNSDRENPNNLRYQSIDGHMNDMPQNGSTACEIKRDEEISSLRYRLVFLYEDGPRPHAEDFKTGKSDWLIWEWRLPFQSRDKTYSQSFCGKLRIVTGMAYTSAGGKKRVCYYYDGKYF